MGRYLITADRVWDGVAAEPIPDGFVLVDGDRIDAIGRRADLGHDTPDRLAHVDLPGATVLPGLINGHVHLGLSGSDRPVRDYKTDARAGVAALTVRAVRNLQAAAASGVTTLRDLGTPNEVAFAVRAAVRDGGLVGPRVVTSGHPITVTGGHCHWFSHQCDSATEIRTAIRRQVRDGADWTKLMLSGGNLTPRTNPLRPQYSAEEMRACVDESDRLGVRVAVHAYDPESIRLAAATGAHTVEHCLFETADGIGYDPAIADLMAEQGTAFVPTIIGAIDRMCDAPPLIAARFKKMGREIREVFRKLLAAGVPLVPGSDAGVPGRDFGGFPGDLGGLVGAAGVGLRPREALAAATSGAAARLGIDDTGVLAPGRRADLLAVDGDPLRDIGAIVHPRLVLAGGSRVPCRCSPNGSDT